MSLRRLHNYLGVFFAPTIIFFAFTGALQTLGLHEHRGPGPYQPPQWIVTLASIHKDQTLPHPHPEAERHGQPQDADAHAHEDHEEATPWPLKSFVLALSAGLIASALMGVWIALKSALTRRGSLIALALGAAAPVVLLFV